MNSEMLDEMKNEEGLEKYRFKIGKDITGKYLKLTLRKKQEVKDKPYDIYEVCKVIDNGVDDPEFIPLYHESFTPQQVEEFYGNPISYHAGHVLR